MEKRRIKRVPVLHAKKVVGIVTRSNLMHAMVSLARTERKAVNDDATIRQKLLEEIKKEKWALASMINVVVRDGVVELWGAIVDERQGAALKVVAENVPGVKEVKDHLAWVESASGVIIEARDKAATH
jgi:osmotically-inducible protein OsmY